ncbi:MAG: hypothetical protein ACJ79H_05380 [Myxococcales bacterium]
MLKKLELRADRNNGFAARGGRRGYHPLLARDAMNQRQRLLVVDESADTRATLSGYLDRIGYRAQFASGGDEALAMLRDGLQAAAVVYDDVVQPAMSGSAFVQQLRSDGKLTPVLVMIKPFQLLDLGDRLLRMWADQARTVSVPESAASAADGPPEG